MPRLSRFTLAIGAVALALALDTGAAGAQDDSKDREAQALFEAGRQAFETGRYSVALSRWQEAHALSGRPALLYNIGLAHDRLRHDEDAVTAFEAFLAALPDDSRAPEVRARIEAIQAARVPSPLEVARASADAEPGAQAPPVSPRPVGELDDSPWYSSWLLWAGIGGVVVASVVLVAVATAKDEGTERAEPNTGLTVQALAL